MTWLQGRRSCQKNMVPAILPLSAFVRRCEKFCDPSKTKCERSRESYKSDYQIAQAREQSLSNSLGTAVAQSQMKDHAQVQLQELESGAQTSKSLYDNFLQRYMDAVQQQSFPITEARVISFADTPSTKSFPKTSLVLLLATAIGLVLSFGVASLRELTDRVFRSSEQVEEALSVNCLAMLPLLKAASAVKSEESSDVEALSCPPSRSRLVRHHAMLDHVLNDPLSQFTEGLRAVKVATDFNGVMKSKRGHRHNVDAASRRQVDNIGEFCADDRAFRSQRYFD